MALAINKLAAYNLQIMRRSIEGLVGVNPGQNARQKGMGDDLFQNSLAFREIIEQGSKVLGLTAKGSLNPEFQYSGVMFAIGAHAALSQRLQGYPADIISLSIGENAAFVQQDIAPLEKIIKGLAIRQLRTESLRVHEPDLLKGMIAIIGVDPSLVQEWLTEIGGRVSEGIESKIVNYNSNNEGVMAFRAKLGEGLADARDVARRIKRTWPFEQASAIAIRVANSFHHPEWMKEEAREFQHDVLSVITPADFSDPLPGRRIYSPTLQRFIRDGADGFVSFYNQVGETVYFGAGCQVLDRQGFAAAVGFDSRGTVMPIFNNNLSGRKGVESYNITDMNSLDFAADQISRKLNLP